MRKKVDATKGSIVPLIFTYAIPLVFSTVLQYFFEIADKAVLGNMAGSTAVASVGATGVVTSLIINGAVGLSTGTAIILARYVGQKNAEKIRQTIDTSILASLAMGLIIAVFGFFLAPIFLSATNCPPECYDGAILYMRIYLAAAPAFLLYNYGSAILRTLGDTQKPLIYITIAGVVNVVLNVILCLVLTQKVAAVAIATVVSKIISSGLVMWRLCHFETSAKVQIKRMRFSPSAMGQIFRFGIPASISQLVLPLGNLQVVTAINSFGVDAVAGNSAAISIHGIVSSFSAAFGSATTTFMGQNIGANQPSRVKQSFWYNMGFNVLISGVIGVLTCLTGEFWLGIIVGHSATEAIAYGMSRLMHVVMFLFIMAHNQILTSALLAFGYPLLTSITNIAFNLGFRVLWMQFIYPLNPVFDTIMLCFTVSWLLNMTFYIIFFSFVYRRYVKYGICKKI